MSKLVIAEKPMLARDIARAICGVPVSESARLPIAGNGYTVAACAGHLIELCEPEEIDAAWGKPWSLEVLPIAPMPWPMRPAAGKEQLVNDIADMLQTCDSVVHAGDPDDEGQLIVDELLDYLGYEGKVERVFVNDNIEANIRRAFDDLKDNAECRGAGRAALARSIADFCFGVNETRLATKKLGALLTVGRVQTPTLGLVVNRDEAISGHTKSVYYHVVAECGVDGKGQAPFVFKPEKELGKHLLDVSIAEQMREALTGTSVAVETTVSEKVEAAPLPYNLTVLLADMSRRYGMSAQTTQQTTQQLRDKYKAITYNRTDCQYLKSEHHEQASTTLAAAMNNLGVSWPLDFSLRSKAFNDANVSAHHGIIPQAIDVDVSAMTDTERKVYTAIVERYAMQFMPPERADVSVSTFEVEHGVFECRCKRITDPGYKATFGANGAEKGANEAEWDGWLDAGSHNADVQKVSISERETKPPAPYTEGTLITDMASIAKYVSDPEIKAVLKAKDDGKKGEHGGIGTTATRAAIIEGLKKHGLLVEDKGKIRSTELGRTFYHLLPAEIAAPDTTAKWWLIQQDVAEGKAEVDAVMRSVVECFLAHKDTAYAGQRIARADRKKLGKCPVCGQDVVAVKNGCTCSSNKNAKRDDGTWEQVEGCGFRLFGWCSKRFTEKQLENLLAGKTIAVKGFKSKAGKTFDAKVKIGAEGKIEPVWGK